MPSSPTKTAFEKEEQRLSQLAQYNILDTDTEECYDEIAVLATQLCESPYSFISFLDKDRQWFKSVVGLYLRELPIKSSICSKLLMMDSETSGVLIIDDLTKIPNYGTSFLKKAHPDVRSYISVPITTSSGYIIGSLCVLDINSEKFTREHVVGLKTLASQIRNQLELAKVNDDQNKLLIQYSKLSDLGSYAATIAHEINNPLSVLNSKVSLLQFKAETDGVVKQEEINIFCESFEKNIFRVANIIKGLKNIGRDTRNDSFEDANLKEIVNDTMELCQKKIQNEGVELRMGLVPDFNFECISAQISQVLLNLINNAFDAIENNPERWIKVDFKDLGSTFEIQVIDSGSGIPEEIREKIFGNFFTTKGVGKGTGIGLSVSSQIVKDHGGKIWVDSSCLNTKFVVSLAKKQQTRDKVEKSSAE